MSTMLLEGPAAVAALPLYIQEQGASVGVDGERIVIRKNDRVLHEARFIDISHVCVLGNVQLSTQAVRGLAARHIPLLYMSRSGWLQAVVSGPGHKHGELRIAQHRTALSRRDGLALARLFVAGKIDNARTLLRRNAKSTEDVAPALRRLRSAREVALRTASVKSLLGVEGAAARAYFGAFAFMLTEAARETWTFGGRNRRPPRDPVNALLSFTYSLLVQDAFNAVVGRGLDPYVGVYHVAKHGRPALALDVAEEFRPLLADSVVLRLLNNNMVDQGDFEERDGGVFLNDSGRATVIAAYESRLHTPAIHPVYEQTVPYRTIVALQTRLLARAFTDPSQTYKPFVTR